MLSILQATMIRTPWLLGYKLTDQLTVGQAINECKDITANSPDNELKNIATYSSLNIKLLPNTYQDSKQYMLRQSLSHECPAVRERECESE